MIDLTSEQVKAKAPNPDGKGGFADNPQNINHGGRPKNIQRYDYWLQFFKDMKLSDFEKYTLLRPEGEMYIAEAHAYKCIRSSASDVKLWSIVADRTEGKPGLKVANAITTGEVQFYNDVPRPVSHDGK